MEGAVPVQKAKVVNFYDEEELKGCKFRPGQAYLITQKNGTKAIVFRSKQRLFLDTRFQLEGDQGEDETKWKYAKNNRCIDMYADDYEDFGSDEESVEEGDDVEVGEEGKMIGPRAVASAFSNSLQFSTTMSFRILSLPALVHDKIFEQMILKEIFFLSVLSKRTRKALRSSFATHPVQLTINDYKNFSIYKINAETYKEDETDGFVMMPENISQLNEERNYEFIRYELLGFLSYDIVPVVETVKGWWNAREITTYWTDETKAFHPAIEHFAQTFPKLFVRMEHTASNSQEFSETLRILRNYNVELLEVNVRTPNDIDDAMVKLLLDGCRDAKILHVFNKTSPDFQYNFETGGSFKGYEIRIQAQRWLTLDHLLNFFMGFECVCLRERSFTDDELRIIFTEWINDSNIQEFQMRYKGRNTLAPIFENMEGAVPVQKAKVFDLYSEEFEGYKFRPGQAYLLTQKDGTKAIVYRSEQCLFLDTRFQLEGNEDEDETKWKYAENKTCYSWLGSDDEDFGSDEESDEEDDVEVSGEEEDEAASDEEEDDVDVSDEEEDDTGDEDSDVDQDNKSDSE